MDDDPIGARIDHFRDELIGQANLILGNRQDAEDVVQETFCDATRERHQLPAGDSLGIWLRTLNRYNAISRLRGRKRDSARIQARQRELPEEDFTTGGFSRMELLDSLQTAMTTLPEHLRTVVQLRYWEHLSYKQIAQRLKIPLGTVSGWLWDASVLLYAQLKDHFAASSPIAAESDTQQNDPVSYSRKPEDA